MSDHEIVDIEHHVVANPWKPWVFVHVETASGYQGVGEATTPRKPETVTTAIDEVAHRYLGNSPFETERFRLEMYRTEGGMMPHRINMAAMSALDMACWDLKGKILDQPVYNLLGGSVQGDSLRAYANGWYTDAGGEPEGFAEAATEVVEAGYDAMKFDPFGAAWLRMERREIEDAMDIVKAVREAVGPDVDLLIEAHYRFAPGTAVDIARRLEDFDITWLEQPTPPDNDAALKRVVEHSSVPVAVDRSPESRVNQDLLSTGVDILQPDLIYVGGITEAKKIAGMAEAEHLSLAPHNANGPVSTAACVHLDATTSNFMIQEVFADFAYQDWADDLTTRGPAIADGRLQLPDDPGLGIELDMDVVRDNTYDPSTDAEDKLDLFEKEWETRNLGE
ncbi:mandelate racemase/muconate lactonizing enzyme family protein [Halococcus agarilyticus]|uniref:mandelate racemase/muconate lactonizing enzyme family protein n=1 Tax=Halococcus agarilyticus TaxID=1232219 RepID=UPI000677FB54|nr:mandelate racemase/muconate lactonizing enzyme family protein [Halococcus agarilyticus]